MEVEVLTSKNTHSSTGLKMQVISIFVKKYIYFQVHKIRHDQNMILCQNELDFNIW